MGDNWRRTGVTNRQKCSAVADALTHTYANDMAFSLIKGKNMFTS